MYYQIKLTLRHGQLAGHVAYLSKNYRSKYPGSRITNITKQIKTFQSKAGALRWIETNRAVVEPFYTDVEKRYV
jgi:hypothetical protein